MMAALRILDRAWTSLGAFLLLLFACSEPTATGPDLARGAAGGGGKAPSVKSTNPATGARGTTLDVQVIGSGFDAGSRARWALNGDTTAAVTKVITNATTFVSSTELIANISIGADATLDLYDVMVVTGGGKKGIGIEKFEVTVLINLLPDLGGTSSAWAINSSGTVVGGSGNQAGTTFVPVRWTPSGTTWTISALAGSGDGVALGINDAGTIVGQRNQVAFLWTTAGAAIPLGPGNANDINQSETVVGSSGGIAAVWTKTSATTWSGPELLPILPGGQGQFATSEAMGINDANVVVGHAWDANGVERAVKWELSSGQWIGPTIVDQTFASYIWDINELGDMAGGFCGAPAPPTCNAFDAVFWPSGGAALVLPGISNWSSAVGLNNLGEVVGWSNTAARRNIVPKTMPVFWSSAVLRRLFLPPGFIGGMANGINDNGQAVGNATRSTGLDNAAVWTVHP